MGFGNFFSADKNSETQTTSISNDNRQVNDASQGGSVISGANNTITDGGAFGIVSKMVDGVVQVAQAQTVAARDMGTGKNSDMAFTDAAKNNVKGFLGLPENQSYALIGGGLVLAVLVLVKVMH